MDTERVDKELAIMKKLYPSAILGGDFTHVLTPSFILPKGWGMDHTEFMFELPNVYPAVAPDNFYVSEGLRIKVNGNPPASYEENVEKFSKKWGKFSWHTEGSWRPHIDIEKGDNLLTFILCAYERLKKIE